LSKKHIGPFLSIGLAILIIGQPAYVSVAFPQGPPQQITTPAGTVIVPPSSIERPEERGLRAHTNHLIFVPGKPQVTPGPPAGENPGSLACVYNIVSLYQNSGCPTNPSGSFANPTGGGGVIAIVAAYHYPTAYTDLSAFSGQFNLPVLNDCTNNPLTTNCFQVVSATSGNCGWNQEAALDIEWAHAMAPGASIVLVEAASSSLSDLLAAVDYASGIAGVRQVSMSWGSGEFPRERNYDFHFNRSGIAYFASSGDTGGKTIWPGVSPNVVSAGGTRVNRDGSGNFTGESAWSKETCGSGPCGGGGGPSRFEARPSYQNVIQGIVGSSRGTPDFSFDADPYTGVAVYGPYCSSSGSGWMVFGGTSVSSPALAGIVNLAGHNLGSGSGSSYPEQVLLYTGYPNYGSITFRDITSGNTGYAAGFNWDFATGIGSNQGLNGK